MGLTNQNSDTGRRSGQLLRLLLHVGENLKTHLSYLALQLRAILVCEKGSRSFTWLMEAKIQIYPAKSEEHYRTFTAMCLPSRSLSHKSPRGSCLLQIPGVKDR